MPVNILPVKKETYYSNIEVTSKEKQDGTILATELNDLKMTFNILRKNIYQILFMKITYQNSTSTSGISLVQLCSNSCERNQQNVLI